MVMKYKERYQPVSVLIRGNQSYQFKNLDSLKLLLISFLYRNLFRLTWKNIVPYMRVFTHCTRDLKQER